MRLDKFLKVSRLIKRRTQANELASNGRVKVNGKLAKPGHTLSVGDELEITFGEQVSRVRVLAIRQHVNKDEASSLYEII